LKVRHIHDALLTSHDSIFLSGGFLLS